MIENFLLKMIEWNELSRRDFRHLIPINGKMITSWVSNCTLSGLHRIFAHFDSQDSWKALLNAIELFRNLTEETAQILGFEYPVDLDNNLSNFILSLRKE